MDRAPVEAAYQPDLEASRLVTLLASEGIDDLAKLRIVQFFWHTPNVVGDASFFARTLGFHSTELTQCLLDELAACGLLGRWPDAASGPRYGLSPGERTRSLLDWLRLLVESSPALPDVIGTLARRSLHRVRRAVVQRRQARRRSLPEPLG